MKKKSLSIVDILKQLNAWPSTISFILNGKSKAHWISNDLSEKVLQFADKVGYKPNRLARSLRTGKTQTISLMVDDISNPFIANLASNI